MTPHTPLEYEMGVRAYTPSFRKVVNFKHVFRMRYNMAVLSHLGWGVSPVKRVPSLKKIQYLALQGNSLYSK